MVKARTIGMLRALRTARNPVDPSQAAVIWLLIWPALCVASVTALAYFAQVHVGSIGLSSLFLLSVLVSALIAGPAGAWIATVLAFCAFNLFIVEPQFAIRFDAVNLVPLLAFLSSALMIGLLAGRESLERQRAQRAADRLQMLLEASRQLSSRTDDADLGAMLAGQVQGVARAPASVWLTGTGGSLQLSGQAGALDDSARSLALRSLGEDGIVALRALRALRLKAGDRVFGAVVWTVLPQLNALDDIDVQPEVAILADLAAVSLDRLMATEAMASAKARASSEAFRFALLSSVSHDFRTPLATILASATGLLDHGDRFSRETRRDMLSSIKEESERLNRTFTAVMDIVRFQSGLVQFTKADVPVADAVDQALHRFRDPMADRPVERAGFDAGLRVHTDPIFFGQVLANLIDNALKFSPAGSPLRFAIGPAAAATGLVEIGVQDEGPGIPAADLERVFERFYQADRRRITTGGHGMGLAICRAIVEALDGRIEAFSPPPGAATGTLMRVRLPAAALRALPAPASPEPESQEPASSEPESPEPAWDEPAPLGPASHEPALQKSAPHRESHDAKHPVGG